MSGVDVLAVIDREVRRAGGEGYPDGCDLLEARAAVAELIEAVESEGWLGNRIAAALRRVKGEIE